MLKRVAELLLLFCFSTSNAFHGILVPKKDLTLLSLNEPEISTDNESSQQVKSYEEGREPYLEVDVEAYFDGVKVNLYREVAHFYSSTCHLFCVSFHISQARLIMEAGISGKK